MKKSGVNIIILLITLGFSQISFGQTEVLETIATNDSIYLDDNVLPKPGTYEIYISDAKREIHFTDEILFRIEKARDDNEEVLLYLGYYTTVRIFPRSVTDPIEIIEHQEK